MYLRKAARENKNIIMATILCQPVLLIVVNIAVPSEDVTLELLRVLVPELRGLAVEGAGAV